MSVRQKFAFIMIDQYGLMTKYLPLDTAEEIVPVKRITISQNGPGLVYPETIMEQWSLLIDDETSVFINCHEIPSCLDYSKVRKVVITSNVHLRTHVVFPNVRILTTDSPLQTSFASTFPNVTYLKCTRFWKTQVVLESVTELHVHYRTTGVNFDDIMKPFPNLKTLADMEIIEWKPEYPLLRKVIRDDPFLQTVLRDFEVTVETHPNQYFAEITVLTLLAIAKYRKNQTPFKDLIPLYMAMPLYIYQKQCEPKSSFILQAAWRYLSSFF
jgi:hypothetical protein